MDILPKNHFVSLDILEKYIDQIIDIRKNKNNDKKEKKLTEFIYDKNDSIIDRIKTKDDTGDTDIYINSELEGERYKSKLKILDKYQYQKNVDHYTFKLISQLDSID